MATQLQPKCLKPFWRYYGGKWRAAPHYPKPLHKTIVEPFAGAAGYSLRYYWHNIVLVEKYAVVAEMWRYLIAVKPSEIRRIPEVEHVDDLPRWVPQPARWLVGFAMNAAVTHPCKSLSAGRKKLRSMGRVFEGWSVLMRERVAEQVKHIRHWQIIEGDYNLSPNREATWFVDPPYNNRVGSLYVHSDIDYTKLADWCVSRQGQLIVCENDGADWLPFDGFRTLKPGLNNKTGGSKEVMFYLEDL
jgi:hypothetical protein